MSFRGNDIQFEILGRFRPSPESECEVLSTPLPAKAGISLFPKSCVIPAKAGTSKSKNMFTGQYRQAGLLSFKKLNTI